MSVTVLYLGGGAFFRDTVQNGVYQPVKKIGEYIFRFDKIHERVGQTDRHTRTTA